jgi:hypothetical protein
MRARQCDTAPARFSASRHSALATASNGQPELLPKPSPNYRWRRIRPSRLQLGSDSARRPDGAATSLRSSCISPFTPLFFLFVRRSPPLAPPTSPHPSVLSTSWMSLRRPFIRLCLSRSLPTEFVRVRPRTSCSVDLSQAGSRGPITRWARLTRRSPWQGPAESAAQTHHRPGPADRSPAGPRGPASGRAQRTLCSPGPDEIHTPGPADPSKGGPRFIAGRATRTRRSPGPTNLNPSLAADPLSRRGPADPVPAGSRGLVARRALQTPRRPGPADPPPAGPREPVDHGRQAPLKFNRRFPQIRRRAGPADRRPPPRS